jgi:mono/diheme cytochrome c family protein
VTIFRSGQILLIVSLVSGVLAPDSRSLAFAADSASPKTKVAKADRAQADELFASRCAACHGSNGRGDGPAAESLNPKPKNFHDAAWQKSISDATIAKAIVDGGPAVGLSNEMAPNPDLEDQPSVVMALIEKIRQFRQ